MQLRKIFLALFFTFSIWAYAQVPELTPLSKISVLTSGVGDELYFAFGYSVFRVQDLTLGIDVVYNYGIFDTSGENFYLKFAQGRMDYKLERERFDYYLRGYEIQNRWVKEQELNLDLPQKNKLFQSLEKNNLPENKIYQYDYFTNNCATKMWDVLKDNLTNDLEFDETYIDEQFSFRELVHQNINPNSWGAFGIDLALGSVIDRKATPKEHMYLPIYILRQLKVTKIHGKPIAVKETALYEATPKETQNSFFTSPLFLSILVSLLILVITYFDYKKESRSKGLDVILFLVTGLAGLLMCFLWFFTDHIWTVKNYNILWAFPLNAIFLFFIFQRSFPYWASKYFLSLSGLLVILLLFWILNVQSFSIVLIPLLPAFAIRYYYLYTLSKKFKKTSE